MVLNFLSVPWDKSPLISWVWSLGRSDISCPLVYLGQVGCPGTSGLPVATNAPQYLTICCGRSTES